MSTPDYDVIAAEVHRKALENLTNEMAITLMRTSGSPIVTASKDFSTCLLDTKPEHLGFSAHVLVHIASSLIGTQVIEELVVPGDLRPGDGWIVNDPHGAGAMHQGDVSVIMPTFHGDDHLGWSFVNMHVLDIGGVGISGYAPGARDVYQEGLRFPPVRIIRDGAIDSEWTSFIGANVRMPGPVLNDIRSMIAANNTASRKLSDILDEFGPERHALYCEVNKDLTEEVLRERISRLPDGVYEAVDWAEFDGHDGPDLLLEVRLRLEIEGSDLRLHFSGVPQMDSFVNSTKGGMWGQTMAAILTTLLYGDVPINGGVWRPITIELGEPGTIVNSLPPGPVSAAHTEVGLRACKLTKELLTQALSLSDDPVLRGRVAGQCADGFPACAVYGLNQHGGHSLMFYPDSCMGAGGGAQSIHDGQDAYGVTNATGAGIPDIENHEAADPVLFLWRRLVPNSGGPGQLRGGQALDQACAIYRSDGMAGPGFNQCAQVPPRGAGGGLPAGAGNFYPVRATNVAALLEEGTLPTRERLDGETVVVPSKVTHMVLGRGDVFVAVSGGGGGLGDPLLRAPETVAADVRAGYVSAAHAEAVYGVVLDADRAVAAAATDARRADIRRERIGREPEQALSAPAGPGIAVIARDGAWRCASCDEALGAVEDNWRVTGAVVVEAPIAERYAQMEMQVRDRTEAPRVLLREHFCPSCAACLAVDVAVDGAAVAAVRQAAVATA
jgi:N-methylhydantoinase B